MAEIINMPRLSDTMEEGVVATWLKQIGDKIEEGDILAEIETDKATMEFESFNEGTLLYIGVQEGETAPVDTLLAIIGEEGENIDALVKGAGAPAKEEVTEEKSAEAPKVVVAEKVEMPEGAIVVTMPRLSDTMEEGTVAAWLKQVGDKIEEGDILAEIETDKATMEFESFNEGTLLYIGVKEGETVAVDRILAVIGNEGTDVDTVLKANASGNAPALEEEKTAEATKTTEEVPATPTVSGNASLGSRIFASPLAKKIAADKGINLADVAGSGENGRIVKRDVENFTPVARTVVPEATASLTPAAKETAVIAPFIPAGEESSEEVKNSQMRKTTLLSYSRIGHGQRNCFKKNNQCNSRY